MGYIETYKSNIPEHARGSLITIWDILKQMDSEIGEVTLYGLITIWDILKLYSLSECVLPCVCLITIWDILKQCIAIYLRSDSASFNNNMGYIETKRDRERMEDMTEFNNNMGYIETTPPSD